MMVDSEKKVVLLCDDSKLQLKAMQRALQTEYHVITASSGYEAVAFAGLYVPDIIILDIAMYGMSGLEACAKIKRSPLTQNIPIIFISAHNRNEYIAKCHAVGAIDLVSKPFTMQTLIDIIRREITT